MDQQFVDAINNLANAVAGIGGSLQSQAVAILVLAVVAAAGSYLGAFFKTRGQHAAITADLSRIEAQLKVQTAATETIKSQIGKRGELHTLRLKKLEELMEAFLETCEHYRSELDVLAGPNPALTISPAPHQRVVALAKFYFPEHDEPLRQVILAWRYAVSAAATESMTRARKPETLLERWTDSISLPLKAKAEDASDAFQHRLVQSMHDLFAQGEALKEAGHAPA